MKKKTKKSMLLPLFFAAMSFTLIRSTGWVGDSISTIFYQGMLSTQAQCARFTGTRGFTMTSGEKILRARSFGIDFDAIKDPFIGAEIDEVVPAHRKGLRKKRDYAFTKRTTAPYAFIINSPTSALPYSLKGHSIKVRKINMGQEGDIKNHFRKMVLHYFIYGTKPYIAFGVSRGAATTFNAQVIYHFLRNESVSEKQIPALINSYLRMLKDEYTALYALAANLTEKPTGISAKAWKSANRWWNVHVRSDIKSACSVQGKENPLQSHAIRWDLIVPEPVLVVIEGCYDSIDNLLRDSTMPYAKRMFYSWMRLFLKTKFFAFRSRGIDPLTLSSYFPSHIPIALITSHKDTRVPHMHVLHLYEKIRSDKKHLLELKYSTHNGYAYEHEADVRTYLYFLHALYKKYNLPHIPEYALSNL